jgi:hypothetical protein
VAGLCSIACTDGNTSTPAPTPDAAPYVTPTDSGGSQVTSDAAPADAGPTPTSATVKIAKPDAGSSFEITPDSTDIDVDVAVTGFTLVALGSEGTDMTKGQVRLYVDGHDCDDPGEGTDPPLKYNRILPNAGNESTIGMDYCVGGVAALTDKTHTLEARLYHGETELSAFDTLTFKTTFSYKDAAADAPHD